MSRTANPICPGDGDRRHGTVNGYTNHRCRCADCREAQRRYMARYNHSDGGARLALKAARERERKAALQELADAGGLSTEVPT